MEFHAHQIFSQVTSRAFETSQVVLNIFREIESMQNKKRRSVMLTVLTIAIATIAILGY